MIVSSNSSSPTRHTYGSIEHSEFEHTDDHNSSAPTDVNIHAAYLHVMTDLLQSVGVAIAGGFIYFYPEYQIVDPMCTFLFCGLIIWYVIMLHSQ